MNHTWVGKTGVVALTLLALGMGTVEVLLHRHRNRKRPAHVMTRYSRLWQADSGTTADVQALFHPTNED